MTAIDEAFIRAYQGDASLPTANGPRVRVEAPARAAGALNQRNSPDLARSGLLSHLRVDQRVSASMPASELEPARQATARRPLSEFARPAQAAPQQFKPALEVDRFRWSPVCESLVGHHAERFAELVDSLVAADDAGRSLIGIAGASRGAGCTTLAACAARLLVAAGKTVALVDGHFVAPGLAMQLGLAVETGWEDVLAGRAPLGEVVVHSLGDRLALLPLARGDVAAAEKLESIHASVTAGVLRYHYDIVLVDLGALDDPRQATIASRLARQCRLDAVIVTCGRGRTAPFSPERLTQMTPELSKLCLGQVQIAA